MWKKLLIIALIANISMTAASCVTAADNKAQKEEEEPADTYEMLNMLGEIRIPAFWTPKAFSI